MIRITQICFNTKLANGISGYSASVCSLSVFPLIVKSLSSSWTAVTSPPTFPLNKTVLIPLPKKHSSLTSCLCAIGPVSINL